MTIKGDFYKLIQEDETRPFFNLEFLYHIGGKNPRDEFKNVGYGIPLDGCIHRIISFAVKNNLPEEVTLKEYLDEYKKQKDSIKREIIGE